MFLLVRVNVAMLEITDFILTYKTCVELTYSEEVDSTPVQCALGNDRKRCMRVSQMTGHEPDAKMCSLYSNLATSSMDVEERNHF